MGFFRHADQRALVAVIQLVFVTLALHSCIRVSASPGQSSFEFAAYCQKLCIWGRGGNLCRCNAVHFVGKRRTSVSGSDLVSAAGFRRELVDDGRRNDWLIDPVSVGQLFSPLVVPSSDGILVRSDSINDDNGMLMAEMASDGRGGSIVADDSRKDYRPVDQPVTLVDFDVKKGKGVFGATGRQQSAAENQEPGKQNGYKTSTWNKLRRDRVVSRSDDRRKKYSAPRQEGIVADGGGNEGNGPIINVFYRKPPKDGATVKLTTFKSMTSSLPAVSTSTEER